MIKWMFPAASRADHFAPKVRLMCDRFRQIVYQIFPDRFAIGQGHDPASKLALPFYHQPGFRRHLWDEAVIASGLDAAARQQALQQSGQVFYGGDLFGVMDRLDYLQDLGVTTLYFTPLFEAPSNHKYDAVTFERIDPMFGDEQALQQLLERLRQRGMGVIMDAALNHVSEHHPWFQEALAGHSPYKDWFTFGEAEDDSRRRYQCWWGFGHMPELNLHHPGVREPLFHALRHYLDMGIRGWRFDTGQDIGLPFVRAMRSELAPYAGAELLGELMNYAGDWIGPDRFTGVMNYYQRTTVLSWLDGRVGSRQANIALREGYEGHGHDGSLASWNMLASHDTPRLKHLLPDAADRTLALVAQFTLPGIPVIYYGEENGMEGAGDPDCRRPMIWDEARWDMATRDLYRQLIALRQAHPALWRGHLVVLGDRLDGSDALIWLRQTEQPGEAALVVLNRSSTPLDTHVLLPASHLYSTVVLQDALGQAPAIRVEGGLVHIQMGARQAGVFLPHEPLQDFRYFKERNRLA